MITRIEVHFHKATGKDKFVRSDEDIDIQEAGISDGVFYVDCADGTHYFPAESVIRFSVFNEVAKENATNREPYPH